MEDFIMYEEIFNQIRSAANKRNLKDSTIHAYCTSVAHFLNHTAKDIDALTTDDVDIFLTEKKLSGISPETYNHYHSGIRFFYKKYWRRIGMMMTYLVWKGQEVTNGAYKNRNISYSWCYAKSEAQSYDCHYVFRRTSCFRSHTSSLWWYFTHEQNHTHPWWEKSLWSLYFACRPDARDIDRILVSMWQTKRDFVPKFMDRGLSYKDSVIQFFVKVPKEQAFRNTSPRIVYVTALQVICLNPAVM